MKINDFQKHYDNLKTAIDKYNFWKDIQKLDEYIKKDLHDTVIWCNCCKVPMYKKDLIKKFESWKEIICTNSLMGYLDDYEYKEKEFHDYRYRCPKCNNIIRYYQ